MSSMFIRRLLPSFAVSCNHLCLHFIPHFCVAFGFISGPQGPCTRDIRRHCWGVKAGPEAFLDCLTTRVKNEKAGNEIAGEWARHATECGDMKEGGRGGGRLREGRGGGSERRVGG